MRGWPISQWPTTTPIGCCRNAAPCLVGSILSSEFQATLRRLKPDKHRHALKSPVLILISIYLAAEGIAPRNCSMTRQSKSASSRVGFRKLGNGRCGRRRHGIRH